MSDDLDSSSSDDKDHVTNICFMEIEIDNEVLSLNDQSKLSYDELHDAFESLYDKFKKLGHKYSSLKKSHACLLVEKYALEKQAHIVIDSDKVKQLEEENKALKENLDMLNTTLAKFTQGSKILNTMLINQRCAFNKRSLGYQLKRNQKYFKNYFVKAKKII
jgi:hypothetical protein